MKLLHLFSDPVFLSPIAGNLVRKLNLIEKQPKTTNQEIWRRRYYWMRQRSLFTRDYSTLSSLSIAVVGPDIECSFFLVFFFGNSTNSCNIMPLHCATKKLMVTMYDTKTGSISITMHANNIGGRVNPKINRIFLNLTIAAWMPRELSNCGLLAVCLLMTFIRCVNRDTTVITSELKKTNTITTKNRRNAKQLWLIDCT